MISDIKHLAGALILNLLGFTTAVAAIIALSYLRQIPAFVFAGVFFICLFVFGSAAVRVLLSDCLSKRPWREALAVEGISLVCGLALNYAVLAIGTAWTGIGDISIMILSAATGCVVLAAGGKLYLSSQLPRHAKKFYSGIILWQSLSGILATGFIACLFWTWNWLV